MSLAEPTDLLTRHHLTTAERLSQEFETRRILGWGECSLSLQAANCLRASMTRS